MKDHTKIKQGDTFGIRILPGTRKDGSLNHQVIKLGDVQKSTEGNLFKA